MGKKIALSWSGGKDACMSLHMLKEAGHDIVCLFTTLPADIDRTFGHGEKKEAIEAQSEALGIPIHWIPCSFSTYTHDYKKEVTEAKSKYHFEAIAFGDLYLSEHREWGEDVANQVGIEALYPLWMKQSMSLSALDRFIKSGYKAKVIRVSDEKMDRSWLGREIDADFFDDIQQLPICPMGEGGEYHTYVYDGPLFQTPIGVINGETLKLETTHRLEIEVTK
ncbi:diphthine--ammonia ligase [Peribacillus alkalitolerans]|uniref:Dph6-related ATP pyrophosphatase n=1 Tax=Peribacillus alkalitolerans TaxID=1550385 RepID=UPI0013D4E344|nr:diphthine--ammonia ligase [Peribacillus alkalitolerans]